MKTSWEKSIYVIFFPIYILSLYLAIKFPQDGLWPFIMLNIGALTGIPNLARIIRKDKGKTEATGEEKGKPTEGRKYWKYLMVYISAALIICLVIDMFLDKDNAIKYVGLLVIFASIFVLFLVIDLILVVLPQHKKTKEEAAKNKELPNKNAKESEDSEENNANKASEGEDDEWE